MKRVRDSLDIAQETFELKAVWTTARVLTRVPREWGRVDWPEVEFVLCDHVEFGHALSAAVESGDAEIRFVQRATHSRTGEKRTFVHGTPDCPKDFACAGMVPKRACWIGGSSWAEWRHAVRVEVAA